MNIGGQLDLAGRRLAEAGLPGASPRLEAELLMAHALETSRSFLFAHPEQELPAARLADFRRLLQRRLRGEPMAYLLGHREFWSLQLAVGPEVLVPRAETETLVAAALERLPAKAPVRIADLGTGSGAIALALGHERPAAEVHATDISAPALALARHNAERLGIDNVAFHQGSWCAPLDGRFGLIASNPPYVAEADPHLDSGDCRFEPRLALTPGGDGLAALREIVRTAPERLARGGWLLLEHGHDQGPAVRAMLLAGGFGEVETLVDPGDRERVSGGRWPAG